MKHTKEERLNIRLDKTLLEALRTEASNRRVPVSKLVREAISEILKGGK